MPEAALDLWPDIHAAKPRTPLSIMKQQAVMLGKHTSNLLEAEVTTDIYDGDFRHRFVIAVPALDYRYELFTVSHDPMLYPITVLHPITVSLVPKLRNEQEFVDWLKNVLNSDDTKRILASLLAQAES
jgi:hypothetical protein